MSLLQTVINYSGGPGYGSLSKAPRLGERLTLFWSAVSLPPPVFLPSSQLQKAGLSGEAPGRKDTAGGRKEQRGIRWELG